MFNGKLEKQEAFTLSFHITVGLIVGHLTCKVCRAAECIMLALNGVDTVTVDHKPFVKFLDFRVSRVFFIPLSSRF